MKSHLRASGEDLGARSIRRFPGFHRLRQRSNSTGAYTNSNVPIGPGSARVFFSADGIAL
ncbi:MAG TPA: hypothetical protein DEA96_13845 [Leptospiraceae bacterium]|nr:hypothetical protein [Spirochaetaceae bacterium]HBS06045.1 hypothetical protein [Leptospiraceae bacterium]